MQKSERKIVKVASKEPYAAKPEEGVEFLYTFDQNTEVPKARDDVLKKIGSTYTFYHPNRDVPLRLCYPGGEDMLFRELIFTQV